MRYALLIHGRAGAWDQSPSQSLHARGGPRKASRRLIRFCAETHLAHIVRAVGAPVDVFIHTWHPELATFIDGIYGEALRGSQHEPVHSKLPKAQSQALSIGKVAALALSHGSIAKLALVLRLDLAVLEPPRLDLFSPVAATTAQWCCLGSARNGLQVQAAVQSACGAADLQLRSSEPASARWKQRVFRRCTVWRIRGQTRHMGVRNMSEDDARVLHDQWIAAPLAVLQRWLELASPSGWESVRRRSVQMHLSRTGRYLWSHEVWPLWLQQLNVSSRFHPWRTTYTWALRFAVGVVARAYARGVLPGAPSWRRPQQQGRGRGLQQHYAVPCCLKAKAWPAASLRPLLLRAHPQALRCT